MRTPIEIAWAAGFFDGEGTIGTTPNLNGHLRRSVRMLVTSTDRDSLERFDKFVGMGSVYSKLKLQNGLGKKPLWTWGLSNYQGVQTLVAMFWPYLSRHRKNQAKKALAEANAPSPHSYKQGGPPIRTIRYA